MTFNFFVVWKETEILTFSKVFHNDNVHFKLKYEDTNKVHPGVFG